MQRTPRFLAGLAGAGVCLALAGAPVGAQEPWREQVLEALRERLSDPSADRPLLHAQQVASLGHVYFRPASPEECAALRVPLPGDDEVKRFRAARQGVESEALDLLDAHPQASQEELRTGLRQASTTSPPGSRPQRSPAPSPVQTTP